MSTEHFLPGKDASLEATISRLQEQLEQIGFQVEERSWLNPIENVWSVHLVDSDCPLLFSNGKGGSPLAARASALGEFFERLSCRYYWSNFHMGDHFARAEFAHHPAERWFALNKKGTWPKECLTSELIAFYNPDQSVPAENLVDFNSGNTERGICALPFTRVSDGQEVLFPVNIIGNLYVSNGMAAGNTPSEARVQALSEILERHVKFEILRQNLCLPDVPADVLAQYPAIQQGINSLAQAGFTVRAKDASLGGQYPVACVYLLNPADQGCYASFGAHPRFEVALERALTELLQGRALDALAGFPEPGFELEDIASAPNLETHFIDSSGVIGWRFLSNTADFDFAHWTFSSASATTAQEYARLTELIHAKGHQIYQADYAHMGVSACRIIVPGLSEIYPLDDLEFENNSQGNSLRQSLIKLPELDEDECAGLLEQIDELALEDSQSVPALIGLAADAGSLWDDLRIGELKTLLALACGDTEIALEGCQWLHYAEHLAPQRQKLYRCVESLLRLQDEGEDADYTAAIDALYGADIHQKAQALVMGEDRFPGFTPLGKNFEQSAMHQRLLQAYEKSQRALAAFAAS